MTLVAISCLFSSVLMGCSTDQASQVNSKKSAKVGDSLINNDVKTMTDSSAGRVDGDLENLRAHVERQQQQLEMMRDEQQALQERLKRQQFALTIKPTANANAGRTKQGTASTAYVAFLEEESQFTETETLAAKEISIIPNRDVSLTLTMPPDTRFIAVKVGLRHTKKRSQFLIPIASLTTDTPLTLSVGACDVTIIDGIDTKLVPAFTTKLKYYQQPLVSCL
ncbi:hypothetical protein CIK80_12245 [Psychrobacter sp. JB193]|nr:hypothetical protein CIK80_12245 [Psychrobacter sp. JB193]